MLAYVFQPAKTPPHVGSHKHGLRTIAHVTPPNGGRRSAVQILIYKDHHVAIMCNLRDVSSLEIQALLHRWAACSAPRCRSLGKSPSNSGHCHMVLSCYLLDDSGFPGFFFGLQSVEALAYRTYVQLKLRHASRCNNKMTHVVGRYNP